MPPYFKPLRRKMGVLTLVFACVLLAKWIKSIDMNEYPLLWHYVADEETYYQARLWNGGIRLSKFTLKERNKSFKLYGASSFILPYWSIVVPLALSSAWMLLRRTKGVRTL